MYAIPMRAYIDVLKKIGPVGKFETIWRKRAYRAWEYDKNEKSGGVPSYS